MSVSSIDQADRAIGSMIFSFFGGFWISWSSIQANGIQPGILALIATIAAALLIASFLHFRRNQQARAEASHLPERKRRARLFNIVNILQGLAIFIAANVTARLGHAEWFKPAFIFIVGAHFLPLGALFKRRQHYIVGGAMILVALIYPLLSSEGPANPIGCLGAGLILWASSLSTLLSFRTARLGDSK